MKILTPEQLEVGKIYKEQLSGLNVLIVERYCAHTDMDSAANKMFKYFYNGEFRTSDIDTGQFIEMEDSDIDRIFRKTEEFLKKL